MADPLDDPTKFTRLSEAGESSFFVEFWHFLRENKKWWLLPILISLLLLGGLVFLTGTAAAPLIYTLF